MNETFARFGRIIALAQAMLLAVFAFDVWKEHKTMLARAEALLHLLAQIGRRNVEGYRTLYMNAAAGGMGEGCGMCDALL